TRPPTPRPGSGRRRVRRWRWRPPLRSESTCDVGEGLRRRDPAVRLDEFATAQTRGQGLGQMVANRLGYLVHATLDRVGPPVSVGRHRGIGPAWQRGRWEPLPKGDRIGKRGHRGRDVLVATRLPPRKPDAAAGRMTDRGAPE